MRTWKIATGIALLATLSWGCSMFEAKVFQPKPLDAMKETAASSETAALDTELRAFLRDQYTIGSSRYFTVPGEIPWIAISKSVQNQMAEKSIQPTVFDWHEPGIDFIDVYPQGKSAFALAMPKETPSGAAKLVGFYVLKAR